MSGAEEACTAELQTCNAILLVGLPGSGKSRLAGRLAKCGWTVCCQDDLGSRAACDELAWETLAQGGHVVIDRVNACAGQRLQWVQLCRAVCPQGRVAAVVVRAAVTDCIQRVVERCGHPTLQGDEAGEVIARFASEFQDPIESEGFAQVLFCESDGDLENLLSSPAANTPSLPHQSKSCSIACAAQPDVLACAAQPDLLANVLGKMACVYVTEYRADESSADTRVQWKGREGTNVATSRVQPVAVPMFEEGLFVPTVKVHGRCCRWKGGQPYRRLDLNLVEGGATRISRNVETQVDIFMKRIFNEFGMDLGKCWQAGADREWSWRAALQTKWGWISACLEGGWWPTSMPDRHGHWIGYTLVKHTRWSNTNRSTSLLPVEQDADVRHGFDEERGVAFCLKWPAENSTAGADRLSLEEVPMAAMQDGTYELVGPHDSQGGPYKDCLPLVSEDIHYPKRFPGWDGDRNERHYFIRHGSLQWGRNPPPSPLEMDAFRQWMRISGVEGVVWHGTGRFSGCMYKCHFGHLVLPARNLCFSRDHTFVEPSAATESNAGAPQLGVIASDTCMIRRCPALTHGQQVVLLRHGESVAQTSTRKLRGESRSLLDTSLSERGKMQAARVRIVDMPELVVTSPLTRTLQTQGAIASHLECPCIAHPFLQEFSRMKPVGFESVGRTVRELQADTRIDRLSGVDLTLLGGLDHQWWADLAEPAAPRIAAFLDWLRARKEQFILVIAHGNVMQQLLAFQGPSSFENCDPINCVLRESGLQHMRMPALPTNTSKTGELRLRICREGDQKDVKIVKIQRESSIKELLKIGQNKWGAKKFKPRSVYLGNGQELTECALRSIADDVLITFK